MAQPITQSTAIRISLEAYLAADHVSPGTGLTIPITISKNGAAFANPNAGATNATEVGGAGNGDGSYYVDLDTTDTNTAGPLIVRGQEGTIDDIKIHLFVDNVPSAVRKNTALPNFPFTMVQTNGITPATGLAVAAQRRIDAGAFAACANAVTEVGFGVYTIDLAASDLNGDVITLRFTNAGAAQRVITMLTRP